MEKKQQKSSAKVKKKKAPFLDFTTRNYQLFGLAVLVIVLGYVALAKGPADSFWSLTLAPVLLVIGYCVIIPVSIFWRSKPKTPSHN